MGLETDVSDHHRPLRVLVVGAWSDILEPFIQALKDAGFDVTTHLPPGPDQPAIDSTDFDIAVVDFHGHSPARDAMSVVERLRRSSNYPIVLTNTAQAERAQPQLAQFPLMRKSKNVTGIADRWQTIKQSPSIHSSEYTSTAVLMTAVWGALKDQRGNT